MTMTPCRFPLIRKRLNVFPQSQAIPQKEYAHSQENINGELVSSSLGLLSKITIKQEPPDHGQDMKPVVMRNTSVGTHILPYLKPKPSPVVIVSHQGGGSSFVCRSPKSPFNIKPLLQTNNFNNVNKHRVSNSAGRAAGHFASNLPPLLPKPPVVLTSKMPKREDLPPVEPKKLEFMAALGLITPQTMIDIQAKRQERKRRSHCISPYSSLLMEPEPKKLNRLMMLPVKRGRGKSRPPKYHSSSAPCSPKTTSPIPNGLGDSGAANKRLRYRRFITEDSPADENDEHDDSCAICKTSGELLMCDTCNLVYHLNCLDPPLTSIPPGMWMCPKCKEAASDSGTLPWPGMLSVVRSYMAHKTAKEDEKNYLIKRSQELQAEKVELEAKAKRLSQSIM
ncbi:hypothetical protein QZH41_018942, partial [Actinostola sp. cb2023]